METVKKDLTLKDAVKRLNTEVMETDQYSWFNFDNRNRPINEDRVEHFIKEFNRGNYFMHEFPAIVNDNWTVLDGQHRYVACTRTGMPFMFRLSNTLTMENVVDVQARAAWSTDDYIHSFVKQGNQNYIILSRFMARYKMTASVAVKLLNGPGTSLHECGFYKGTYKVKHEETGHRVAKIILDVLSMTPKIKMATSFAKAMVKLVAHKEYNHKRMLSQLAKYPGLLMRQVNVNAQIENFEEVYNYHLTVKNKVRFV